MTDSAASAAPSGEKPGTDSISTLSADEVLSEYNTRARQSKWRQEARQLYDLVASRQWDPEDEAKLKEQMRPMVTFNVAGKYMDAMVGLQINNRQETRFFPRELGDAKPNELLTGGVTWARDLCDQQDDETDAFYDCALTGMGWMEGYLDTDLEEGGVPAGQRVDPMEMFPDPSARKRNLSDARYLIRIRFMDAAEYKHLTGMEWTGEDDFAREAVDDDGIQVVEEPQDYDSEPGSTQSMYVRSGKKAVADYQFWRRETGYILSAPTEQPRVMREDEFKALTAANPSILLMIQSGIIKARKIGRIYYRAYICAGQVSKLGFSPYQEGFTYHAITGKRDRNKNVFYGIGRSLLDPQKWLNKFFSTILYVMMVNAKGGLLAERAAFEDARKAEDTWADPSAITFLNDGALTKGMIEPKPEAKYPQGLDRLMEFSLNILPQTSGLNVELMGLADRVQAGVVEAQRKQSAMAIIAWAFDAMRRYYRSMGRQQARYLIDYVPAGTIVRISGKDSDKYVPLMKQQLSMTFDVIVDEAPTSVNMKERVWAVLETMIPKLLQAGMAIPPSVLDYSPLPADLAAEWKQALKPDPGKEQQQQQQLGAMMRKLISEALKNETQAQLNVAKAGEAEAGATESMASATHKAAQAGATMAGS